jgi:hypothetical protein
MITEDYIMCKRLITEMDSAYFLKTFSAIMLYADVDNPLVLAAEKIMLLLSLGRYEYDQIAMEIYIENSYEKGFIDLMEKRYALSTKELNLLMKSCGLAAVMGNSPRGNQLISPPNRTAILINDMSRNDITPEKLRCYSYSFLLEALKAAPAESPENYLNLIEGELHEAQRRLYHSKENRKIVFVVGSESGWDSVVEAPELITDRDSVFYCVMPKRSQIFGESAGCKYSPPADAAAIDIFVKDEHYVASCMEAGVSPDMLVFVDCIGTEYPWDYFIRKYPLEVLMTSLCTEDISRDGSELSLLGYLDRIGE